ncbi:hypothetical protein ARTHRO9V_90274 [Arthrobacter sp. 9V]|nr:hypothetical protein ARTHRO9V_90274 [Arthrobacter sp. 9V]
MVLPAAPHLFPPIAPVTTGADGAKGSDPGAEGVPPAGTGAFGANWWGPDVEIGVCGERERVRDIGLCG